jgi:hypothetical protein
MTTRGTPANPDQSVFPAESAPWAEVVDVNPSEATASAAFSPSVTTTILAPSRRGRL